MDHLSYGRSHPSAETRLRVGTFKPINSPVAINQSGWTSSHPSRFQEALPGGSSVGRGALPSVVNIFLHKTIKPLLCLPAKIQTAALLFLRESRKAGSPAAALLIPGVVWFPAGVPRRPPMRTASWAGILFLDGGSFLSLVGGTRALSLGQVFVNHLYKARVPQGGVPRDRPWGVHVGPASPHHVHGPISLIFSIGAGEVSRVPILGQALSFLTHFQQPLPLGRCG